MARDISNSADILDSRDIIARIADLQSELQANFDTEDGDTAAAPEIDWDNADAVASLQTLMPERWERIMLEPEMDELLSLLRLQEEASDSPDWEHGEALIRNSYFEDYARDLAEDIGAIDRDAKWPNNYIDWEAATDALKQDYMSVDFDGVEYWIRA